MKYIGNYADWINIEWVHYLLNNEGTPRPKTTKANPDSPEFRKATSAGYDLTQTYWQHYDQDSCPLTFIPPFKTNGKLMWWFIKMLPGNFMPMHCDPHVTESGVIDCKRYWIPLQDYEHGHVFIYNKEFITDYKAGDVFMYDDANEIHGACNIGYTPRLVANFSTYTYETPR